MADETILREHARLSALVPLLEVSQTFLQTLDLKTVLDVVVKTAARETRADVVSVMLLDRDSGELRVEAAVGLSEEVAASSRVRLGKGISGWVAQEGKPLLLREDVSLPPTVRQAMHRQAVTSALCLPLGTRGQVIGVLNLSRLGDHPPFTQSDLDLYTVLCAQASIAIENARLHTELQEAYRELQMLDRLKTEFFSIVSHELRTPLHTIRGFVRLLLEGKVADPATQRECLSVAASEAQRLSRLIDDLLDLARIETGHLGLRWTGVSVGEVVEQAVAGLRHLAEEKAVTLQVQVSPGLPVVVGDPDRLTQVVSNLVDNAIKFTGAGGRVEVSARQVQAHPPAWPGRAGRGAREGVLVEVRDTGVGISPDALPHLFDPFYQADGSTQCLRGGLGLGLYICKQIVEEHGGRIWVESVPTGAGAEAHGSTFRFILPVQTPELPP